MARRRAQAGRWVAVTIATGVLVAAAAACSSGDDDDSAEEPRPPEYTATTLDRAPGDDSDNSDDSADATSETGDGEQAGAEEASGVDGEDGASGEASPEQIVEATYDAYWELREHAIKFPDPDDPSLDDVTTGPALDELSQTVSALENVGQEGQFGALDSHHVYDVRFDGDASATVSDCAISDARVVVAATGEVVRTDPPEGSSFVYTATMVRDDDGRWRVDGITREPLPADQVCTNDGPAGMGS